jgi:hypothetical protein
MMATTPKKPNIQIDDLEREMTDEEYQIYLLIIAAEPTRTEI